MYGVLVDVAILCVCRHCITCVCAVCVGGRSIHLCAWGWNPTCISAFWPFLVSSALLLHLPYHAVCIVSHRALSSQAPHYVAATVQPQSHSKSVWTTSMRVLTLRMRGRATTRNIWHALLLLFAILCRVNNSNYVGIRTASPPTDGSATFRFCRWFVRWGAVNKLLRRIHV